MQAIPHASAMDEEQHEKQGGTLLWIFVPNHMCCGADVETGVNTHTKMLARLSQMLSGACLQNFLEIVTVCENV